MGLMLEAVIKTAAAYLIGGAMGSLIIGRLRGGIDIRGVGSGNPGGTNALRTQGPAFALGVMIIDVGKGALAAGLLPALELSSAGGWFQAAPNWEQALCGTAAVAGHVWPIWYGFRGGKGAATLIGVIAVIAPLALLPVLGAWLIMLVLTGYVGLATITAAWTLPVFEGFRGPAILFAFGAVMAVFLTYTHRSNIQRLRAGTEHRFESVMLLRRLLTHGH